MDSLLILTFIIIGLALIFDFINGFHDAANSIATIVSTRVLTPFKAVAWAAFWNFAAALTFGTAVAKTIGSGLLNIEMIDSYVILAGLCGAIIWNLITWFLGLPTSSSHALIGGYAGAALFKAGPEVLIAAGWIKTLSFIVLAPLIGFVLGMFVKFLLLWIFRKSNRTKTNSLFQKGQLISSALYSLGHGTNDAQKTMGIIATALFTVPAYQYLVMDAEGNLFIPTWIIFAAYIAIALGTLSGGWRIVKTMGSKITKLKPMGGFAAETAGAVTLFGASTLGIPVSTTHTITGAIIGVGVTRRFRSVRWSLAGRIVWAWILTLPASGLMAGLIYLIIGLFR